MNRQNNDNHEDDGVQITDLESEQAAPEGSLRLKRRGIVSPLFLNTRIRTGLFLLLLVSLIGVLFWQAAPWQLNRSSVLNPTPDLSQWPLDTSSHGVTSNHRLFLQDRFERLGAYQIETGSLLWNTSLAATAAIQAGDQAVYVYFLHQPGIGRLEALQANNGQVLWQRDLPLESPPTNVWISHNILYVGGAAGAIYAVQASNGHLNWLYTPNDRSSPPNPILRVQGAIVEARLGKQAVVLLDAQTGQVIITVPSGTSADLYIEGSQLYVLPSPGSVEKSILEVFRIDQGGKRLWSRAFPITEELFYEQDNVLYLSRFDGSELKALRGSDGQTLWAYKPPAGDAIEYWFPATDNRLTLLTGQNVLIGLNAKTGKAIWENRLPALAKSPLGSIRAESQRDLLFVTRIQQPGEQTPGTFFVLSADDGHLLWQATSAGESGLPDNIILNTLQNGSIQAWSTAGHYLWSYQDKAPVFVYETLEYQKPLLLLRGARGGIVVLQLNTGQKLWGTPVS
ncbi:MAG TPA: PQQ-binding-like beta-propeller repeat protein [Ktedonobacteraceae bacterium]|nr:PQQ-binding-like beta-propeller repeat protein [Ktedonobacteraceae bacterium]